MKDLFFEFYPLSEERIKHIFEFGILILDTSALLNLYRHSKRSRNSLINLLTEHQARIWIPYQVGWEYHRNLNNTISSVESTCDNFIKNLNHARSEFFKNLNLKGFRHPKMDVESIKSKINQSFNEIEKEVKDTHVFNSDNQEFHDLKDKIAELFNGRIGLDFTKSKLEEIYRNGYIRYENQIPPGYCDFKNKIDKTEREKYGDLIVWEQIIEYSKEHKVDIILITGDKKCDWFEQNNHELITPRKELIKEFRIETGKDILIYEFADFINKINDILSLNVETSTLTEVDEISKENCLYHNQSYMYIDGLGVNSPYKSSLLYNQNPNLEYIKDMLEPSPFESHIASISPLEQYLRANSTNPNLEIIKRMEKVSPFESHIVSSSPLEQYLRANSTNPNLEIIKRLEKVSPFESHIVSSSPLEQYLRANSTNPNLEIIKRLEKV